MSITVMKQMASAMSAMLTHMGMDEDEWNKMTFEQMRQALEAGRQAIAEAEKQEPAMRIEYWPSADSDRYIANMIPWEQLPIGTLLYTSPPQRQPLTDEQLETLWDDATDRMEHFCSQYWDFARAIEAAHGIKGDA